MRAPRDAPHEKIQFVVSEIIGQVFGMRPLDDFKHSLLLQIDVLPNRHGSGC